MGYKHRHRGKTTDPIWFGGRLFSPVKTQGTSETSSETVFKYEQKGNLVTATYSGGDIEFGQLMALVQSDYSLDMRYQHLNKDGLLMTGICHSVPYIWTCLYE